MELRAIFSCGSFLLVRIIRRPAMHLAVALFQQRRPLAALCNARKKRRPEPRLQPALTPRRARRKSRSHPMSDPQTPPRKDNPNSVGVGNRGPMPDLHNLPMTPERQKEVDKILRQMSDPSTPLGSMCKKLGVLNEKPQGAPCRPDSNR